MLENTRGRKTQAVLLLLLSSLHLFHASDFVSKCSQFVAKQDHCQCDPSLRYGGYEIACPSFVAPRLAITFVPEKVLQVQCHSFDRDHYLHLKHLRFDAAPVVNLKLCPLPSFSFERIFRGMGLGPTRKLTFNSFSKVALTINPAYFEGMRALSDLQMQHNNISVLHPLPLHNLTALYLSENELRVHESMFMHYKNLQILELGSNRIANLPRQTFEPLGRLRILNLQKNVLKSLHPQQFANQDQLESLDLHGNRIELLHEDTFSKAGRLRQLDLSHNRLLSLPEALFGNNRELEYVSLSFNRDMREFPEHLFDNNTELKELYISHCAIGNIRRGSFGSLRSLRNLSIASNRLKFIPTGSFGSLKELVHLDASENFVRNLGAIPISELENLRTLDLHGNLITIVTEQNFQPLRKLRSLDLSDNAIATIAQKTFVQNRDLSYVSMSGNLIQMNGAPLSTAPSSPFGACVNLEHLDLSRNNLTYISDDWKLLLKLRVLDLRTNAFRSLTGFDLNFLSEGLEVYLQDNKIETVDVEFLPKSDLKRSNRKQNYIHLNRNPLVCDCKMLSFVSYVHKQHLLRAKFTFDLDMTCSKPDSDSTIISIICVNVADLYCPIERQCPKLCSCKLRATDGAIVVDCRSQNLTAIPSTMPLNTSVLMLHNNSIETLENLEMYSNLRELNLSGNKVKALEVTSWPKSLRVLDLQSNEFEALEQGTSKSLIHFLRNPSSVLLLGGNKWACDCRVFALRNLGHAYYASILDLANVTCENHTAVMEMQIDSMCNATATSKIVNACIAFAAILMAVSGVLLVYSRHSDTIKVWLHAHRMLCWSAASAEKELDRDKRYDAFISYSHKDEEFVLRELVQKLENQEPKYSLCLHFRDWLPGEWIPTQIACSVQSSRRTIIVLSKNFMASIWGHMEFRLAHKQALQDRHNGVIVIVYGELPPFEKIDASLRMYLRTNTYLKWGDPWFWERLRYALPHKGRSGNKGKQRASATDGSS